ncbi:MAG: hypothetical protein ACP5O7_08405 [Phycisphaerae bacterium]
MDNAFLWTRFWHNKAVRVSQNGDPSDGVYISAAPFKGQSEPGVVVVVDLGRVC